MKKINTVGLRFGRLIVVREYRGKEHIYVECKCDCGNIKSLRRYSLLAGDTLSCGCLQKEQLEKRQKDNKHIREKFQEKIIPCQYMIEREPYLVINKIVKLKKVGRNEAEKIYKDWRKDYRKNIMRDIV